MSTWYILYYIIYLSRYVGIQLTKHRLTNVSYTCGIYLVLHCGDVPKVTYTTNTSITTPKYPGDNFIYECVRGAALQGSSEIKCEVDEEEKKAKWTGLSAIKCVPGICYVICIILFKT